MTEGEWLTQTGCSQWMVQQVRETGSLVRTKAGKRKLRLFACGCCRLIWDLLTDPRLRTAVEVAERFADSQASKEELQTAFQSIHRLVMRRSCNPDDSNTMAWIAARMALATTASTAVTCAFDMTCWSFPLAGYTDGGVSGEAILCNLLRCVFGNPFRPVAIDPSWLAWNDNTTSRLAQGIYNERRFADLPILADALEEAGCTHSDILNHCRQPGKHTRGCWVVDCLLNK